MTQSLPASTLPNKLRDLVDRQPDAQVLAWRDQAMTAADLQQKALRMGSALVASDIMPGDRIAIWLPKQFETIIAIWAAAMAGAVFIPVSPTLKPAQVTHILRDSAAVLLISTQDRLRHLEASALNIKCWAVDDLPEMAATDFVPVDQDINALAALLYTSGSTGKPKGVMISHANLTLGAASVASYLRITPKDRLLCVLPLSFDYGLNQVMTAIHTGAQAVLFEYLLPRDILKALTQYRITGLAGVPALWSQLTTLDWPDNHLRYITNSGGRMPKPILDELILKTNGCDVYLMYGLTEAFRSTYLDPSQVAAHPDSVGKAIPYAEVKVVRPDGSETDANETGELVHMGPLVAQGYWHDPVRTEMRFRPAPACADKPGSPSVWSGDKARRDANGLIYFIARDDEMIKSSGYRISPTEIEEVVYALPGIADVVVLGVADDRIGEMIVAVVATANGRTFDGAAALAHCRQSLPSYMVPGRWVIRDVLPRNANGKLDRSTIAASVRAGEWQ